MSRLFCGWNCCLFAAAALCLPWSCLGADHPPIATQEEIDFNFQVRPILSDRCFKCHGPDEKSRKAGLRLDTAEGAYAVCDKKTGARAVVPGNVERSEVVRRITSSDPDVMMPPPQSHLQLSQKDIE